MGCKSSKSAVQSIQVSQDGVVTLSSAPVHPSKGVDTIESAESFVNQTSHVEVHKDVPKSTSAKSRDSGIDEMDLFEKPDAIDQEIAEFAAPNAVNDPTDYIQKPQEASSLNSMLQEPIKKNVEVERLQSEAILKELETAGLIQASKFNKGGAAFEVDLGESRKPSLPPLAPLNRLPPRLERLKGQKKIVNKEDLEKKIRNAEQRRTAKMERRKSRLAQRLARDKENALKMETDDATPSTPAPSEPTAPLHTTTTTREMGDGRVSSSLKDDNVFEGSDISSLDSAPVTPAFGTPSF